MNTKSVVRASKMYRPTTSARLQLFSVDKDGDEILAMTSSPVPKIAAASICWLLEQPFAIKPDAELLKDVFQITGKTAWASYTARNAHTAATQACLQHNIKAAQGALVIITLSPDSNIVGSIKTALQVIQAKTPAVIARAIVVTHDEGLSCQVRVEMLLTGL